MPKVGGSTSIESFLDAWAKAAARSNKIFNILDLKDRRAANTPDAFTARRYASAVYAVVICLSVRLSDTRHYCTKNGQKVGSRKQRRTIS